MLIFGGVDGLISDLQPSYSILQEPPNLGHHFRTKNWATRVTRDLSHHFYGWNMSNQMEDQNYNNPNRL